MQTKYASGYPIKLPQIQDGNPENRFFGNGNLTYLFFWFCCTKIVHVYNNNNMCDNSHNMIVFFFCSECWKIVGSSFFFFESVLLTILQKKQNISNSDSRFTIMKIRQEYPNQYAEISKAVSLLSSSIESKDTSVSFPSKFITNDFVTPVFL